MSAGGAGPAGSPEQAGRECSELGGECGINVLFQNRSRFCKPWLAAGVNLCAQPGLQSSGEATGSTLTTPGAEPASPVLPVGSSPLKRLLRNVCSWLFVTSDISRS